MLVNALNEQEITINAQTEKIADLKLQLLKLENSSGFASQKVGAKISEEQNISAHPLLNQNTPNPFNIETKIGFYLPNSIITASLYVYDMNGNQLKSYSINERGKGNIIIQGYELNAGMYLYTLIADNDVIDTKRMILTK